MNLSEFKAWFEGYTENMEGAPNKKQWKRICERVGEIVEAPATTYPIFIDRYVRPYWPYYGGGYITCSGQTISASNGGQITGTTSNYQYNSQDAFRDLGRMEAQTN